MPVWTARWLGVVLLVALVAGCSPDPEPEEPPVEVAHGVTDEPCPDTVNEDNGCIYLGTITDLSVGPLAGIAVPLTDAQAAFWRRVNEDGGIGGYDVDATTHVRDNESSPETHAAAFEEIREEVLALAQTLGSSHTAEILGDLDDEDLVAAPASWTSAWAFEDVIAQSGASYCVEAMNAVDYAFDELDDLEEVLVVHFPGDYGEDAAYGVRASAEAHEAGFTAVETAPGAEHQVEALETVLDRDPDLVFVATGALEMATIVGQAAARGFQGRVIGSGPTWDPGLLDSPAADALEALYWRAAPWETFTADTPGHAAMQDALGDVAANDAYTAGWVFQYPLKAAIETAVDRGDLTRTGLRTAFEDLREVDYEGMLPPDAGNFTPGEPNEQAFRESGVAEVDPESETGVRALVAFTAGATARDLDLSSPCFDQF